LQLEEPLHPGRTAERSLCAVYCRLSAYLLFLSIFRGEFSIVLPSSFPSGRLIILGMTQEYHKNPSTLSSRQFTPLAIYKFRSFNELDHEFSLRLSSIRPLANLYLSSYPRAKTALVSRFVAFLAGSFAAVLILFSIIDPDAFLHFEVTPGRTVLFWIGILGGVVAVARGMTPAQEGEAFRARLEPGEIMKEIVELSRYCPDEWEGKLHAYSVCLAELPYVLWRTELMSITESCRFINLSHLYSHRNLYCSYKRSSRFSSLRSSYSSLYRIVLARLSTSSESSRSKSRDWEEFAVSL